MKQGTVTYSGIAGAVIAQIAARVLGFAPEDAGAFSAELAPVLLDLVSLAGAATAIYGRYRIKRAAYE